MPYYIYRIVEIGPIRRLETMSEHAAYSDAAAQLKRSRSESDPVLGIIRMIFADNRLRAEELLSEVRPPRPLIGDDY